MPLKLLSRLKEEILNIDADIYQEIYEYQEDEKENGNFSVKLLDLYNEILNSISDDRLLEKNLLKESLDEDYISTIKLLFYTRDIEYGLGRRDVFRDAIRYTALNYSEKLKDYIYLIPKYGRWDDLYSLFDTPCEEDVINIFKEQINKDIESDSPSNLGKWLKSINTSSEASRELARKTAKGLNLSYSEYRKLTSELRKKIGVVEQKISNNEWDKIKYGDVPALAYKKYKEAFIKNDYERFQDYENISKINRSTNFDIKNNNDTISFINYLRILLDIDYKGEESSKYEEELINFIKSMDIQSGNWITALSISKSDLSNQSNYLIESLYFSLYYLYNNTGLFKDYIMKTSKPCNFKKIKTDDMLEKIKEIISNSISDYINIESILDLILLAAIKHGIDDENLPAGVLIIVDDIDKIKVANICSEREKEHFGYDKLQEKWRSAGYTVPEIKILELNRKSKFSIKELNKNFYVITGFGEKIFDTVINDELDLMDENLNINNNIENGCNINNNLDEILKNERYNI